MSLGDARARVPGRPVPSGLALAVGSAASFGLSGPFAKALIDAGWTPTGTVLVRLGGAAVVLAGILAATRPGVLAAIRRDGFGLLRYGVLAMALVQLAFFNAMRYLPVPVALLLEYAGPVLVIGWVWLVRRQPPTRRTLLGAGLAVAGLLMVVQVWSAGAVSWPGLAWGFGAAVCQAGYFLLADRVGVTTPPLVLAGAGMAVGAATVALVGLLGLLPLAVDPGVHRVLLAGVNVGWPVAATLLVLVSTVLAYCAGIGAIHRLGASRASLVGLLEVVSSALASWLLLGEEPAPVQLVGGALLLTGVAVTQSRPFPRRRPRRP